MPPQYIFTIEKLSKAYAKQEVLKNIWLAFYPGAKIGVIGSNGSGKSTLLRIMAGLETRTSSARPGQRRVSPSAMCRRSRGWTQHGRARQRRAGGGHRCGPCSTRFEEIKPGWAKGPTPTRWTSCSTSWAGCRKRSMPPTPGSWTASSKSPWMPCGCRRAMPRSARSPAANAGALPFARCFCERPTCSCSTSRPTISTPRRSPGSSGTAGIPGHRRAVTHDRYFLDNVAKWILELDRGQGIPFKGNYSSWLEQKQARLGRGEAGKHPPQATGSRAGVGANVAASPGCQE